MIDAASISREIDKIMEREGSEYTDSPADRGGPCKFGVTLAAFRAAFPERMRSTSFAHDLDMLRNLTEVDARTIYRDLYIHHPGFDHITDPRLFSLVVDSGVQHGPKRATEWLQAALDVTADGVLGPVTRGALEKYDNPLSSAGHSGTIYKRILATRLRFYSALIERDHTQAAFALGWTNRMIPFIDVMELP